MNYTMEEYKAVELFHGVSHEAISYILEECPVRSLFSGEVLLSPKRENRHVYLLLKGALCIHLESPDHDSVATIPTGGCVGEMSIIDSKVPSAHVVADGPCRLLVIDQVRVWNLVHVSHHISCNLLYILSQRMRYNNALIVEGHKRQQLLENFARVDALTGLFNRRWLDETLDRQVGRSLSSGLALSLVLLDADRFKNYNDTHGHLGGDCALIALSHVLSDNLRPGDIAARFGGEEFAVVLPETSLEAALGIAERLRSKVANKTIKSSDGGELPHVTISAGVAFLKEAGTVTDLIADADAALYCAKEQGRNRICHAPKG